FKGVGDFLGDGHADFLIRNTGNQTPGKLFVGEVVSGNLTFTQISAVGPEWEFVGNGPYLSASKDDFLIRNTSIGALVVGAVNNGTASFTTVGGVGPEWNFQTSNVAEVP